MVIPIGVVTGSGIRTRAKPATRNALCKRLRGFIILLIVLVFFMSYPRLFVHPVIQLLTLPG
jgi:hypothetical protein